MGVKVLRFSIIPLAMVVLDSPEGVGVLLRPVVESPRFRAMLPQLGLVPDYNLTQRLFALPMIMSKQGHASDCSRIVQSPGPHSRRHPQCKYAYLSAPLSFAWSHPMLLAGWRERAKQPSAS